MKQRSGEPRSVNRALARLARLKSDRNIPGLIAELESPLGRGRYSLVRGHAARALGDVGDPRAVPYLVRLTEDPSDSVRTDVMYALGKIGTPDCLPPLLAGLGDPSAVTRMGAAEGLGRMRATEASGSLRRVVDSDQDFEVRLHAAEALAEMGDEAVAARIPEIMRHIRFWTRRTPRWKRLRAYAENAKGAG